MQLPYFEKRDNDYTVTPSNLGRFPAHIHPQIEMIWVKKGSTTISIDGCDYDISQGECVLIFPHNIHSYNGVGDDVQAVLYIVSPGLCGRFESLLLKKVPRTPVIQKSDMHADAQYALTALEKCAAGEDESVLEAFLQLIIARELPFLHLYTRDKEASSSDVQKALVYISNEYSNPMNLETVAEALSMSRFKLSRIFTNDLGISFTRYVQVLRVERAKAMLLEESMSIVQTAYECGFETLRSFNRVFLNITGKTPREYRQLTR